MRQAGSLDGRVSVAIRSKGGIGIADSEVPGIPGWVMPALRRLKTYPVRLPRGGSGMHDSLLEEASSISCGT